jgi:hypothetical protein
MTADLWDANDDDSSARHNKETSVPRPTADIGTLLELVELARYLHRFHPIAGGKRSPRRDCLTYAVSHPSVLLSTRVTMQQRDFVRECRDPWTTIRFWIACAFDLQAARLTLRRVERARRPTRKTAIRAEAP